MSNPFEEILHRLDKIEGLIAEVKKTNFIDLNSDKWMSICELSEYLPGKPSLATIYNWTHRRKIPSHKMGKKLSFLKSEIDKWLQGNLKMTKEDIKQVASEFIKHNKKKGYSL
jgi:excisionase family DNA binding protein